MANHDFPCPVCCKHTKVSDEILESGGIATCNHCGYRVKFLGRKNNPEQKPKRRSGRCGKRKY